MVPVIEELKVQLENSLELSSDAQKAINSIKRNTEGIYANADEPVRTWNIISKGMVSLKAQSSDVQTDKAKSHFGPDGKRKAGY